MQIKYYINIKDNTLRFKVSIFKMGIVPLLTVGKLKVGINTKEIQFQVEKVELHCKELYTVKLVCSLINLIIYTV